MLLTRLWWSLYKAYHLQGQARYPYRPLAAIRRDQSRRVRAAVAHAYRHVPYYRETMRSLGLTPADFQSAADLAKLPLLERPQLQRDPEYFVTGGQPRPGWLKWRTGGSTGTPATMYYNTAGLMQVAAYSHREAPVLAAVIGRPWGYRQSMITNIPGGSFYLINYLDRLTLSPHGTRLQKQFLNMYDPLEENLRQLNEFQPDLLHSFGSYFTLLFSYLEANSAPFHRPRLIAYASDRLPESIRRLINDKYGLPVLSEYGACEAMKIGFECEAHRGLHLQADLYPLRLVDAEGREVPAGETGEVVVSDLVNRATVLLNYRLGDLASLRPEACPCGRTLPLLSFPQGRVADFILSPSGEKIHPEKAIGLVETDPDVWQFQIVQKALNHLEVRLVVTEQGSREELRQRVAQAFAPQFGPDFRVEVVFVADVERTPAGKVRLVLSMLPEAPETAPTG